MSKSSKTLKTIAMVLLFITSAPVFFASIADMIENRNLNSLGSSVLSALLFMLGVHISKQLREHEEEEKKIKSASISQFNIALNAGGSLPIITDNSILLRKGETCHYSKPAHRIVLKNKVTGYAGATSGASIRIAKGVTYRVGANRGVPIRENVAESYPGKLIVTNMRIIFVSPQGGFDKSIEKLTTITPAGEGMLFQFGSQSYIVDLQSDANYACQLIKRIIQGSDSSDSDDDEQDE